MIKVGFVIFSSYCLDIKILNTDDILERFLKPYKDVRGEVTVDASSEPVVNLIQRNTPPVHVKTPGQRYNLALQVATDVANAIYETGEQQFLSRIQVLKNLLGIYRPHSEAVVLPLEQWYTFLQ